MPAHDGNRNRGTDGTADDSNGGNGHNSSGQSDYDNRSKYASNKGATDSNRKDNVPIPRWNASKHSRDDR
ncbi:hypothetical protein SD074_28350 [Prolixibacter sp. SD074]|nr:hypothetical protein SD074_28350 [Prolixibacter sp. SD074]